MPSLTLICHAATLSTRSVVFPAEDEPLDLAGDAAARAAPRLRRVDAAWTSPTRRARQTAEALGLAAAAEPALRDLDCGAWTGRALDEVAACEPDAVAAWLGDPEAAPHGGESVAALVRRIGRWLDAVAQQEGRVVAVTHAAVLRAALAAALEAKPAAFWRVDVAPLGRVCLRWRAGRWCLLSLGR